MLELLCCVLGVYLAIYIYGNPVMKVKKYQMILYGATARTYKVELNLLEK